MESDLATLYQVQQIDTRIEELERERAALDSGAALRAEVETLRTQVEAARQQLRTLEAEFHDTELQIKTRETKKKDFEDKMYSGRVRNPKELEDMRQEVEMLKAQVDKLTDRGISLMDATETQRAALAEQEALLRQQEAALSQVEQRFATENARIAQELARLAAQREPLVAAIPADLLRRYDDLRAKRANLAVVMVTGEVCPGCRIALSLDTRRQLKQGARIICCESCGRMLYSQQSPAPLQGGPA